MTAPSSTSAPDQFSSSASPDVPAPVRAFEDLNRAIGTGSHLDIQERRRFMRTVSDLNFYLHGAPAEAEVRRETVTVPTAAGPIEVVLYRPPDRRVLPAHLFLHGGAWWAGNPGELVNDAIARRRAFDADVVVAAVTYSLAPETRFPRAVHEVLDTFEWLRDNARPLRIDADNISFGGMSAGGNLAAAATILNRDRSGPPLRLQVLEVPVLDLTLATSRRIAIALPHVDTDELAPAIDCYLGPDIDRTHPYASPLLADDLTNLPPALVITAGLDPLRGDGHNYALRLQQAGIPARWLEIPGAVHSAAYLTRTWPSAVTWAATANDALKTVHAS